MIDVKEFLKKEGFLDSEQFDWAFDVKYDEAALRANCHEKNGKWFSSATGTFIADSAQGVCESLDLSAVIVAPTKIMVLDKQQSELATETGLRIAVIHGVTFMAVMPKEPADA